MKFDEAIAGLEIGPGQDRYWPDMVTHLSASSISMFMRCPEQWRQHYVLKKTERPGAALIWGAADHAAHELNFTQKIESHEDLPVPEVQDAFRDSVEKQSEERDDIAWGSETPATVIDAGTRLVGLYTAQVSPDIQPIAVEEEFSLDIEGSPVPVVGRIDVVAQIPLGLTPPWDEDQLATGCIERKTSSKSVRDPKPEWLTQGRIYQMIKSAPVDWHVSVKTKIPKIQTPRQNPMLHQPLRQQEMSSTLRLIAQASNMIRFNWQTYGAEQPWPGATSHPWACGFCGFRGDCYWWS